VAIKSKLVRLVGQVTGIGERTGEHRNETAWNTLASRWEDNIKTYFKKRQKDGLDWTGFNRLRFITRGNTGMQG